MHLKEIELENFKSFSRKTKIPILPGYTAITGPNGSGKSNISDGILFVLGPKSSRVIRAGKLTDLICNGGKSGHTASECKVSLYFDNADRLIPYDADTVKLTRIVRVSDSVEGYYSYYYINDRKSSLGDIESLLSHARISADGYNFVQQGDITKIVNMGNVERRRILDDISGISRFDDEINHAEKERTEAEENISKLNIIVDELRKQMKQLEADRESAMKYRDMRDKLLLSKAQLATKKKDEIERELAAVQTQIATYDQNKVKIEAHIEELKDKLKQLDDEMAEKDAEMIKKGGQSAKELKEKLDQIRVELARADDAVQTSEDALKTLAEQSKNLKIEVKKVTKELDGLRERRDVLTADIAKKSKALEKLRSDMTGRQGVAAESDAKIGKMQSSLDALVKEITTKEDSLRGLSIEQDTLTAKIERVKGEISQLEETKKTYEFELEDAEFSAKQLTGDKKDSAAGMKKLQEEYFAKRNEEKKLTKESLELEEAIKTLTREYNKLKAEVDAVKMVAEGYNAAVGRVMEARDKSEIKGIHGTVSDLCKVDPKYETALMVAAGNRMQSVIVDTDEAASKSIDLLKREKRGRVTFLPLNKMVEGKARGKAILASKKSLGYAIDLVEFDEKYRAALWFVLSDTIVVADLREARAMMGGIRIVTLDGELIEASGAMVGGTLDRRSGKFGGATPSMIEKVSRDLRTATDEAEKVGERLRELKEELTKIEDGLKTANMSNGGQDGKLASFEVKRKEFNQKISGAKSAIDAKGKELSESLDSLEDMKKQLEGLSAVVEKMKKDRDALLEKIQKATPKEVAQELKKIQESVIELTTELADLNAQKETAVKSIELVEARKSEFDASLKSCTDQTKANKDKISESVERKKSLETELAANRKIEESMGAAIEKLRKDRDDLYKKRTDCDASIDASQTKIETTQDLVIGLKTKQGAAETALAEITTELTNYKDVDLTKGKIPPINELKEYIQSAEAQLNTMGVVNLRAIEDYDERKQRFEDIKTEISTLTKQRTNLMKLVEELNDKKKFGLQKVFGSIKENFQRIYADLSNGGEADLLLEVPDDPLTGGLIIHARPRNQKQLRLEALSGGEKSLTALSFIFAIQAYQPSPFYLLDEVDMFLDGLNAENVARAIAKNSANAQFMQVSLRKTTLKEADHMIGVAKQPNGLSQVVIRPNIGDEVFEEEDQKPAEEVGSA
jgi:chromosome segregation protein